MAQLIMKSTKMEDYEILIRRNGDGKYASYCPQLNYMIKGSEHQEVAEKMENYVREYIKSLEAD